MTVSDNLHDASMRHTVYLLRWSRGTYRRHSNLIDELIADLSAKLAMRAPSDNSFTRARLEAMLGNVEQLGSRVFSALEAAIDGDYRKLAEYEADFQVNAIQNAYPIEMSLAAVTPAQIHSAAMSQPFRGRVLKGWWSHQSYTTKEAFKRALRIGFSEGETIQQITSRLRDVGGMTKKDIEAIVRTATNHMAQVARDKVTEANKDIFNEEEWVATLDGRTTAVCRGRDGKRYAIGSGPKPPAHFGCRSQRIPITKSWKELGLDDLSEDSRLNTRPFVADKRRVKDIPKSERGQIIGTTTKKSYNEWLRTQSKSFVEDVLGKTKAKLYLDGDLPLDRFIDRKGQELTLEQLRDRESKIVKEAFKKADLTS
jgi:SPP1 gp7 family putative phage head morphogenesis protein